MPTAYVADSAVVIGDVVIGPDSSLWFHAVVRGDVERIRIGAAHERPGQRDHPRGARTAGRRSSAPT